MMTPFKAQSRPAPRGGLIVPVLALLSMTFPANADSPASAIQIVDVDVVQAAPVGARRDCWDDAPVDATVLCVRPEPEHGSLMVEITLENEATTDLVVAYESMDLTATGGIDYVALDGTVSIATGEDSATLDISFIDDLVEEGNETFVVKVTPPDGVDVKQDYIHVTIIDEESVKVLIATESQTEGHPDGMLVDLSFTRSVPWSFTFRARTTAGTAGTSDYNDWPYLYSRVISGTRNRPVISFRFRHPLIDDSLDEPDETYTITAWGYDNLSRETNSATMTIIDDDDPPSVSIADASGLEDSVGKLSFDVTLNTQSAKEITLGYATSDDSATAGSDYTQKSETLTFSAGRTTKKISVPVLADGSPEEDETFTVTLSNAVNATIGDGTGTGTIQDDDPVPASFAIEDVVAVESKEAMEFPVTVIGERGEMTTVTVDYATANRTAEAGQDYTETTGSLTFATDVTEQTIRVPLLDDVIDETDEIFEVRLSNAMGATFGDRHAEGKILDDDISSTQITLTPSPARVSEGDGATPVRVTATLDASARAEATSVTVTVSGSGDSDAVDFEDVRDFTITIAAGDKSGTGTFTLTPIDDEVDEADETLALTGGSDLPVSPTSVVLADDDEVVVSRVLSVADAGAAESARDVAFALTLDGPSAAAVTVDYATADPTESVNAVAVAGMDYESVSGTLTLAPGEVSGTIRVPFLDDDVDEPDETFALVLADLRGATLDRRSALGTIRDDDEAPALSVADAAGDESVGALDFAVTLSAPSGLGVSFSYATADGTATAGGDYEGASGTLTFAPGESSRTVSVSLLDDAVYEREENFGLELSSPVNATLGTRTATGTIVDDDRAGKAPTRGRVLLFEPSANPDRQGFVRIINHSAEAGEILVEAVDDSGMRVGPVTLAIDAGEAAHFNSDDLEVGNARKGLPDGVGPPSAGIWRLELSSLLDIEVLSYARTSDGFVTSLHDTAPATAGVHRLVFLNPGRNVDQVSRLRLINPGTEDAFVTIAGTDDGGGVSAEVVVDVPAGTAREWTAAELESGSGTDGALGDGDGKWRLRISSGSPVVAMSLIESPTGNLTNLSTLPRTPGRAEGTHMVPLVPSASDPTGRQGFVRVVNHSGEAVEVRIEAFDDTVWKYEPLALAVGAYEVASFNSDDLELGNEAKGLTGSTGAGEGDWWLELSSDADIEVLSYIRTTDGFLTSMHDLVPEANGVHRVVYFNPARNFNQASVLWLVNTGDADAVATITGVDDEGAMPGTAVRVAVPAGSSRRLTSAELESGEAAAIGSGALGDGDGKWRLSVGSDMPIVVVSLLENPTGHLTNLSTAPERGAKP